MSGLWAAEKASNSKKWQSTCGRFIQGNKIGLQFPTFICSLVFQPPLLASVGAEMR
jgi:hypothetical protein